MATKPTAANDVQRSDATMIVDQLATNELIFAVVGPVGAGSSAIAETLRDFLDQSDYDVHVVKARRFINEYAAKGGMSDGAANGIDQTVHLQDVGDAMREDLGNSVISEKFAVEIRAIRARAMGVDISSNNPVQPDDKKRAYILDSIRHPAEVALLRKIYQQSFCLIGIVCEESVRLERLSEKYSDAGKEKIRSLMRRDEKDVKKNGQQVSAAFHLSDFFIENT